MKYLILTLLLSFYHLSFSQTYLGALKVQAFQNETNNLDDNQQLDEISVKIINEKSSEEKIVHFTKGNKFKVNLEPGFYTLICAIKGDDDLIYEHVSVTPDKITFIDILIEPTKNLTKTQKRKRKKLGYSNYK